MFLTEVNPERLRRTDKLGNPFEIGIGRGEDFETLLEMYRTFSPKPASQGLPPENPEICKNWVKNLYERSGNTLARRDGRIIGHVSLSPDGRSKSGELAVFDISRGQLQNLTDPHPTPSHQLKNDKNGEDLPEIRNWKWGNPK